MEDIICTVPWSCGDKDCEAGWHRANYWIYSNGTYTIDNYSDGDHDPIEEGEVPSAQEQDEAWLAYFTHVATTGEDPLNEFWVPKGEARPRKWQAQVRNWVGASKHGLRIIAVRRDGRGAWLPVDQAPICVKDFLFAESPEYQFGGGNLRPCRWSIGPELTTFDKLSHAANVALRIGRLGATILFSVDEPGRSMSEEQTKKFLRKAARRNILDIKLRGKVKRGGN